MPTTAAAATSPTEVRLVRHYPVSAERVWDAWTDPQALSLWFGASATGITATTHAELDLRPGGQYSIRFNSPDGSSNEVAGVYHEVTPPSRLVFSWAFHSTPERVSRISINLAPVAGGTELTFVHDRFFDQQARDNHQRGWTLFFTQLDRLLEA